MISCDDAVRLRRLCIVVAICAVACTPARAHHLPPRDGRTVGIEIPAIGHGEMLVIAKYRARVIDLASREPHTDLTLRRLAGFVNLQYFACFWGLIPGSLSDDRSPFNECSHAYLAGTRALLAHMSAMSGDQSAARSLEGEIAKEIVSDPTFGALCVNSGEAFDSGVVVGPDWSRIPLDRSSLLMIAILGIVMAASRRPMSILFRKVLARREAAVAPHGRENEVR